MPRRLREVERLSARRAAHRRAAGSKPPTCRLDLVHSRTRQEYRRDVVRGFMLRGLINAAQARRRRSGRAVRPSWRRPMPDLQLERHRQRPQDFPQRQAASAAARFPARRSQSHRQQGRLRRRRMRHLLGVRRRRADEVLPAAGGEGARRADRHRRVAGQDRRTERAAEGLPQGRRQPVRLLHSRHGDGGDRGAARQSVCRPRGDQGAARRQYLPLHRLSEDFRRGRTGARRAERPPAGERAAGRGSTPRATSSARTCAASMRRARCPAG